MKHKTWFSLMLKAIGVLLVGFGLPSLFEEASGLLLWVNASSYAAAYSDYPLWSFLIGPLKAGLQCGIGLYLFFGARWVVDQAIPSNRPYCPDCGYELSEARGERCPECGVMLPRAGDRAMSDAERHT